MSSGLTSGGDFLKDAARSYFAGHYHNPTMHFSESVDVRLKYTPTIHFRIHSHLTVLVEVSETPYPQILSMRRTDIEDLHIPISVYCACPEEAYLANQADAKRLIAHGFGLITVAQDGTVQKRASCIPLIQRITEEEFKLEIKSLTPSIRRRLTEAYDKYNTSAPSGVTDVAEVVEGFILQAGREAVKKTWIPSNAARPGAPAATLDAFVASPQFIASMAAVGSVRGYISEFRNTSAHFPKNRAQAAKKYRECRHGFLDGLKRVVSFRNSMRDRGLTGNLP